jgi:hypothetical protein
MGFLLLVKKMSYDKRITFFERYFYMIHILSIFFKKKSVFITPYHIVKNAFGHQISANFATGLCILHTSILS